METQIEIWKDIFGYEGYYQVSNLGRVKRLKRMVHVFRRGWDGMKVCRERIMKLSNTAKKKDDDGYLNVSLSKDNRTISKNVHRLVAQAFIPNPKNKPNINHKNAIKSDNRVENIEWNTQKENIEHSIRLGLKKNVYCGEEHKLSHLNVFEIYSLKFIAKSKLCTRDELATLFGYKDTTSITNLINGKSWVRALNNSITKENLSKLDFN